MDDSDPTPGFSVATIPVPLPDRPLAPWLRLAHVTTTPPGRASGTGHERTLLDFMLMLQIDGDSWLHWRDGGGAVEMPRGSIAFVPPGFAHAWGETAGAHIAVHFDLHARPALEAFAPRRRAAGAAPAFAMLRPLGSVVGPRPPPAALPWFRLARADGADPLHIPLVTPLRAPERWRERLMPLVRQWGTRTHAGAGARLRAAALLAAAVADLADEAGGMRAAAPPAAPSDARVVALIERLAAGDPARRWPLPALARAAGLGETALRAAFRRVAGTTPRAWLERARIERAARWLVETRRPIALIATDAGYPDPYHFSRAFRRVLGASPTAFRRRALGLRG